MRRLISALAATLLMAFLAFPAFAAPASVDDQNCDDFDSQAAAQTHYNADTSDPDNLDADNDGLACEGNSAPFSSEYVQANGQTVVPEDVQPTATPTQQPTQEPVTEPTATETPSVPSGMSETGAGGTSFEQLAKFIGDAALAGVTSI